MPQRNAGVLRLRSDSNRGAIPRRGTSAPNRREPEACLAKRETWGTHGSLAQAGRRDFGFSSALLRYFLPYCLLPSTCSGRLSNPSRSF